MATMPPVELVTLRTRVPRTTAELVAALAGRNQRSVAGELRVAIEKHLADASGKDGRK